jgi:hypothetical protein
MIYFKKVHFNYNDKSSVEAALRKSAVKRTSPLDLKSSASDIGTNKKFFGYDGKDAVYFTRIRSSVEKLFPKMIISLPKSETDSFYKIRLSIFPFLFYVLATVGLAINLFFLIIGATDIAGFVGILIFELFFIGLFWIELAITTKRITKVIDDHKAA